MIFQRKSFGKKARQLPDAPIHIKHPITHSAMEVVVVRSGNFCQFIAIRLSRYRHGDQHLIFLHPPDNPINRPLTKRWHFWFGEIENLIDRKRPSGASAYFADSSLLGSVTAFGHD
jgi:hypothetical protein